MKATDLILILVVAIINLMFFAGVPAVDRFGDPVEFVEQMRMIIGGGSLIVIALGMLANRYC